MNCATPCPATYPVARGQREDLFKLRGHPAVGREVVLPAQGIIVQARDARLPGIERHQRTPAHANARYRLLRPAATASMVPARGTMLTAPILTAREAPRAGAAGARQV